MYYIIKKILDLSGVEGVPPSTKSGKKLKEYEQWWSEVLNYVKKILMKSLKGTQVSLKPLLQQLQYNNIIIMLLNEV